MWSILLGPVGWAVWLVTVALAIWHLMRVAAQVPSERGAHEVLEPVDDPAR